MKHKALFFNFYNNFYILIILSSNMKRGIFIILFLAVFLVFSYSKPLTSLSPEQTYLTNEYITSVPCPNQAATFSSSDQKTIYYCTEKSSFNQSKKFVIDSYLQTKFVNCKIDYYPTNISVVFNDKNSQQNNIPTDMAVCVKRDYANSIENLITNSQLTTSQCQTPTGNFTDGDGRTFYHCREGGPAIEEIDIYGTKDTTRMRAIGELDCSQIQCSTFTHDTFLFSDNVYCCDWDFTNQVTEIIQPPATPGCTTSQPPPQTTTKTVPVCKPKPEPLVPIW